MTNITISKNTIEISGHSGYAVVGEDIVCAAISFGSQFLINAYDLKYTEQDGYYNIDTTNADTKAINTFIEMVKGLQTDYKDYVKVIEI
jgi:uncharacterized protein YsxB (DUF464 family)